MSRGRSLQIGDEALTDYNGPGRLEKVRIIDRDDKRQHGHCQSGIMFRVAPNLRNGSNESWYDADWFEPAPRRKFRQTAAARHGYVMCAVTTALARKWSVRLVTGCS